MSTQDSRVRTNLSARRSVMERTTVMMDMTNVGAPAANGARTCLSTDPLVHPVYFIRCLISGESFRFLNFSILKAWHSLIHRHPFLNFQSARILRLHEKLQ